MITLIAISHATALEAQHQILGCEACTEDAEIPLCWVLDQVTGRDGAETDYFLAEPLKCSRCAAAITEEALVEWA